MTNLRQGAWINAADGRFAYIDEHANWAKRPGNLVSVGLAESAWEAIRYIPNDYSGKNRERIVLAVMGVGGIRMRGHGDFITIEFTVDWVVALRACREVLREIDGGFTPCVFTNLTTGESLNISYSEYSEHVDSDIEWILQRRKPFGEAT